VVRGLECHGDGVSGRGFLLAGIDWLSCERFLGGDREVAIECAREETASDGS
jgi:hypothetical protein